MELNDFDAVEDFRRVVLESHLKESSDELMAAAEAARKAHGETGKKEPYTGRPYIFHPVAVATVLLAFKRTKEEVIGGLLHDTLEDTSVTAEDLVNRFGLEVAEIVVSVSNVSKPEDGNRAKRKALDLAHLRSAKAGGRNVKLGDIIVNACTIGERDPVFAATYLAEKHAQVEAVEDGADVLLVAAARNAIWSGMKSIGER